MQSKRDTWIFALDRYAIRSDEEAKAFLNFELDGVDLRDAWPAWANSRLFVFLCLFCRNNTFYIVVSESHFNVPMSKDNYFNILSAVMAHVKVGMLQRDS